MFKALKKSLDPKIIHTEQTLSRRNFLGLGLGTLAAAAFIKPANARFLPFRASPKLIKPEKKIYLYNRHTGEFFKDIYWADGQFNREALKKLNHFMRDHYSHKSTQMDIRLYELLHRLHQNLGTQKPFDIISAYRDPQTNARLRRRSKGVAKESYHMRGQAVDIRSSECSLTQLRNAAIALSGGGVGCYRSINAVHIDTGPVRRWGYQAKA
jgi:uncharacterized protein YcbK (DUF882 family)